MARKRPKINLATRQPTARTGDLGELFASGDDAEQASGLQLVSLRLDTIEADPTQPRTTFDNETLGDLALSIESNGLIQPIEVVQIGKGKYRIVHGERRWRAVQQLGWETMPAIVQRRDYDELTRFVRQLVENIQREDLNDIDRAAGLARLREMMQEELNAQAERGDAPWATKATWAKVAGRIGYSRQRVSQLTKLLELPPEIQQAVINGRISERDARIYHGLSSEQQSALHQMYIAEQRLSLAQAKRVARFLRQNRGTTVLEAVEAVKANRDRERPVKKENRTIEVAGRIAKQLDRLDTDELDAGERRQLVELLRQIQLRVEALVNQLA